MSLRAFVIAGLLVTAAAPATASPADCTVADLTNKVRLLVPGPAVPWCAQNGQPAPCTAVQDFGGDSPYYQPPTPGNAPDQNILGELQRAFALTRNEQGGFRDALCSLDHIFVDRNEQDEQDGAPLGWGFYEGPNQVRPGQNTGTMKAIGLSTRLWNGASGYRLRVFEIFILRTLADWNDVTVQSVRPNTREMGILGVLAHEMGHVQYGPQSRAIPSRCFIGNGWSVILRRKAHAFVRFGDDINGTHAGYSYLPTIRHAVASGDFDGAATMLQTIYEGDDWASLFATLSPEEDFAETLKLVVLKEATTPLRELTVRIAEKPPVNVVSYLNDASTGLAIKAECLRPFFYP